MARTTAGTATNVSHTTPAPTMLHPDLSVIQVDST